MASENLQIPDVLASQNNKEVTMNQAVNALDRAINGDGSYQKVISGSTSFTTTEVRQNPAIEFTGTPGAPFTVDMPDTNRRWLAVKNSADDTATIRNSAAGGTGQPVIPAGAAAIFYYDGTNFIDFTAFAAAGTQFLDLSDTPSAYTDQNGKVLAVNSAESGLEFVGTSTKIPVRVATDAAGTLATDFENGDTVDGVVLATGDRILIKDQASGAENGIYIVQATGAPVRSDDFNDNTDPVFGGIVAVVAGTQNANTVWQLTTAGPYTLDTTVLTFVQVDFIELFTALSDTPSSYTGQSGQLVAVAGGEASLEFVKSVAKEPVRVATVVSGTLATSFENGDIVDGVTLATNDRILIKDQSTGSENGVYIVQATGAPVRADDFDDDVDVTGGVLIPVLEGTENALNVFQLSNTGAITVGTTSLTFRNLNPYTDSVYIPAEEMYAAVGAAALNTAALTSGNPVIRSWDLDQTSAETIQFSMVMPKDWNLGTIDIDIFWSHTTGGTAFDVVLGAAAVSIANDGAQDTAFGTQQTVTDSGGTADDLYIAAITGITVGGTPADGDLVHFEIERLAASGSDTLDLDARIQGALVKYTKR